MFTVKVVRRGQEGNEKVDLYRARHVTTMWDPDNPTIRHVIWTEADTDEHPCVSVGSQLSIEGDEMRVIEVFIENEHGKTTEAIR